MDRSNQEDTLDKAERRYRQLYHKYAHIGCPAAQMEDNCDRPDECAELGRCRNLPPLKEDGDARIETEG
jgi:hypothetical protein